MYLCEIYENRNDILANPKTLTPLSFSFTETLGFTEADATVTITLNEFNLIYPNNFEPWRYCLDFYTIDPRYVAWWGIITKASIDLENETVSLTAINHVSLFKFSWCGGRNNDRLNIGQQGANSSKYDYQLESAPNATTITATTPYGVLATVLTTYKVFNGGVLFNYNNLLVQGATSGTGYKYTFNYTEFKNMLEFAQQFCDHNNMVGVEFSFAHSIDTGRVSVVMSQLQNTVHSFDTTSRILSHGSIEIDGTETSTCFMNKTRTIKPSRGYCVGTFTENNSTTNNNNIIYWGIAGSGEIGWKTGSYDFIPVTDIGNDGALSIAYVLSNAREKLKKLPSSQTTITIRHDTESITSRDYNIKPGDVINYPLIIDGSLLYGNGFILEKKISDNSTAELTLINHIFTIEPCTPSELVLNSGTPRTVANAIKNLEKKNSLRGNVRT